MFGRGVTLFRLFDFEIRLDASWIIIALLVTWSLAQGLFPFYYKGLSNATYWWMGMAGTLGLFVSIVVHELFHSLVARRYGISMRGITLFIFGGVAEMEEEPPSAEAEFFMALAGPVTSIVLGFIFHLMSIWARRNLWAVSVVGVVGYLRGINWILAGFNLLPAFPLDGGRMFRSALWRWKRNLAWATRISSQIGAAFGLALSFIGIINIISGSFIGGIWYFLIGMFLRNASQMSYQRVLLRRALEGEPVGHFMKSNPVTVSPSITLNELVEDYIYRYHFKMFPVIEEDRLIGCVSNREVKEIPKEDWKQRRVRDILKTCSSSNTVSPDTDAMVALSIMNRTGNSRLMVTQGGRLVGIVALKDLLRLFSLKLDLEGEAFR